jgi:hypothetical protein
MIHLIVRTVIQLFEVLAESKALADSSAKALSPAFFDHSKRR